MKSRPLSLLFFLLSVATHVIAAWALGVNGGTQRHAETSQRPLTKVFSVQISENSNAAISSKLAVVSNQSDSALQEQDGKNSSAVVSQSIARESILPIAIPKQHYVDSKELTKKPRVVSDIPPNLTISLPSGSPHTVVVRLLINEEGEIDDVLVDDATFSELTRHLIVQEFSKIKFTPGEIDGVPVASELKIEVALQDSIIVR